MNRLDVLVIATLATLVISVATKLLFTLSLLASL
jgi:hypothetical protein